MILQQISKPEVLRYLGYSNQEINPKLNILIDNCIKETLNIIKPMYIYKFFSINIKDYKVNVLGTNLALEGNDILNHLKRCSKCAILAATLGIKFDNKVKYLEKSSMTEALIIDSCGTEAIELLCDQAENEIKLQANKDGFNITSRYSPGYGDFSITIQNDILNILSAQCSIGLTANENSILIPRKSVTAIIGFTKSNINPNKRSCINCNKYKNCQYRKDDIYCGN